MSKELVVYKNNQEVARGTDKVDLTGLRPNTDYKEGHFQVAFETETGISDLVDVPAFKTEPVDVEVEDIQLSPKTSAGDAGTAGTRQLKASVLPEDATDQLLTYSIEPETEGLSVDENGLIEWSEEVPEGEYVTTVASGSSDVSVAHTLTLSGASEE